MQSSNRSHLFVAGGSAFVFTPSSAACASQLRRIPLSSNLKDGVSDLASSSVLLDFCDVEDIFGVSSSSRPEEYSVLTARGSFRVRDSDFRHPGTRMAIDAEGWTKLTKEGSRVSRMAVGPQNAAVVCIDDSGSSDHCELALFDVKKMLEGSCITPRVKVLERLYEGVPGICFLWEENRACVLNSGGTLDVVQFSENPTFRSDFLDFVDGIVGCGGFSIRGLPCIGAVSPYGSFFARSLVSREDDEVIIKSEVLMEVLHSEIRLAAAFPEGFLVADSRALWKLKIDPKSGDVAVSLFVGRFSDQIPFLEALACASDEDDSRIVLAFRKSGYHAVSVVDPSSEADFAVDVEDPDGDTVDELVQRALVPTTGWELRESLDNFPADLEQEADFAVTLRSGFADPEKVFRLVDMRVGAGVRAGRELKIELDFLLTDAGLNSLRAAASNSASPILWWFVAKCVFGTSRAATSSRRIPAPWARSGKRTFSFVVKRSTVISALKSCRSVDLAFSLRFYDPAHAAGPPSCSLNCVEFVAFRRCLGFDAFSAVLECVSPIPRLVSLRFEAAVREFLTDVPRDAGRCLTSFRNMDDFLTHVVSQLVEEEEEEEEKKKKQEMEQDEAAAAEDEEDENKKKKKKVEKHAHVVELSVADSALADVTAKFGLKPAGVVFEFDACCRNLVLVTWMADSGTGVRVLGWDFRAVEAVAYWIRRAAFPDDDDDDDVSLV